MIVISQEARIVLSSINKALSALTVFVAFMAIGFVSPVSAALFTTDLASGSDTFSASYDNVDDAFDQLTTSALQSALPSYVDPISTATMVVNYRGLDMDFAFPVSGTTELTLVIPELGISESFVGVTRDDSKDLLVAYLEGEGSDTVDRIQKELARVSAVDPVAGNPSSLMGQAVHSDFDRALSLNPSQFSSTPGGRELLGRVFRRDTEASGRAFGTASDTGMVRSPDSGQTATDRASSSMPEAGSKDVSAGVMVGQDQTAVSETDEGNSTSNNSLAESSFESPGGVFGIDLSHRRLDLEGEKATTETLTVEYEYYFEDPLKVIRFKMPLAVTDTEGAKSYHASAGIDFSYPLTRSWSLTPGLSYGVGGSEDLGGGASINGLSLTSTYRLVHGNYLYTLGNMIGRYETGSVSLGDYEIDPDISNTVFRNGLMVYRPSIIYNLPMMIQAFIVDTRYGGDELFTEHYYEVGFAAGIITDEALISEDTFNIGFTYLDATDADIKGYKVNFGYRF